MQIHELNNFTGTPGSTNYLAIDNGSDTARISGTDLLAPVNARIDNVVLQNKSESVNLFAGSISVGGGTYSLSESAANFDFLEFVFNFNGATVQTARVRPNADILISVPGFNATNSPSEVDITRLSVSINGANFTVAQAYNWSWNGDSGANSNTTPAWAWASSLAIEVYGIRYAQLDSTEVTDLRTAHDGTVYQTARAAREADYNALDSEIQDINNAILRYKWVTRELRNGPDLTIQVFNNYSVQTSGSNMITLASTSGFYSYCFIAPKNLLVAANTLGGYYAIGVLVNPNSASSEWRTSGGVYYKYGDSVARYRASDNNLPTRNAPLNIPEGSQVVVTVDSSTIPSLDFYEEQLRNFATEEYVDAAIDELMDNRVMFDGIDLRSTSAFDVESYPNRNASLSTIAGQPSITLDQLTDFYTYSFVTDRELTVACYGSSNDYFSIAVLYEPAQSDWQTSGSTLYKQGSSTVRKRKMENNLPPMDNPLVIPMGSCVCITVKVGENAGILIESDESDTLKNNVIGQNAKYIEVEMHTDYFYYYIPTASGNYLRYKFMHFVNASMNADGWIQRTVDLVSHSKKVEIMPVVRDGEWEMAIMITGRPDFIGCMNHGSEITTLINFYFDGVKSSMVNGKKFICKEIKVNEKSTMYDPADETTVVGYHYKTYIITADGIEIRQRVEWIKSENLGISYTCMLPAVRGNDYVTPIQVTDRAYDEKTFTEYDCSTTTLDPYLQALNDKGNRFNLYGTQSGVSLLAECDIKNRPSSASTFLSNAVYYNKIYFAHNNTNYNVSAGDVWEWTSRYKIAYAPN